MSSITAIGKPRSGSTRWLPDFSLNTISFITVYRLDLGHNTNRL
jgi:hypothetical protein